jgi:hypothetical protein
MPYFAIVSALRCVAPNFSTLKASVPSETHARYCNSAEKCQITPFIAIFFSAEKINFFHKGSFILSEALNLSIYFQ